MHSQELIQQLHTNIQHCITSEQARADLYRSFGNSLADDGAITIQVDLRTEFPPYTKYETRSIPQHALIVESARKLRYEIYHSPRLFVWIIFDIYNEANTRFICYARVVYDANYQFVKVEYYH